MRPPETPSQLWPMGCTSHPSRASPRSSSPATGDSLNPIAMVQTTSLCLIHGVTVSNPGRPGRVDHQSSSPHLALNQGGLGVESFLPLRFP